MTNEKICVSTGCDDGEWGSNCAQTCGNCNNTDICNKINGDCPNGCKAGWKTSKCDKGKGL